ncbi:MAG TPA: prephenate dehydratase [Nitrolancea sp.]
MRIAYLGPEGTFSEEAALTQARREDATLVPFSSIPALVSAVETGLTERAMLPIENSLEGSVSFTLDLLIHETDLKIRNELVVPVRNNLVVVPGTKLEQIKSVTSHPQPFGQCRRFLERCLPNVDKVAALSTAAAVSTVIHAGDPSQAAIGTLRAAELYGGEVLARDIQDNRSNVTRFFLLARHDAEPTGFDRTSFCFNVKQNIPGAVHEVLTELAISNIQMTKIESRPTKSVLGDYTFLIDVEGHRKDPIIAEALDRIRERTARLKVFGSYPRFELNSIDDEFEESA